jgi:transglutaminase-like putative cysteine protease
MRFCVRHQTRYTYSRPVFLEPHIFRLRPREDVTQQLVHFEMEIFPKPAGLSHGLDQEGNSVSWAWFEGLHTDLVVVTHFEAHALRANPFDYLPSPAAMSLPPGLSVAERGALAAALRCGEPEALVIAAFEELQQKSVGATQDFLTQACAWVAKRLESVSRLEPGIQTPGRSLALGSGACRDAAALFMELCRLAGIPARYVSGYQEAAPDQDTHDLHAWAEAYVPGGGWRGFDPTLGLAVGESHLALCASADPLATAPLPGSVRGTGAEMVMNHDIWMAPPGDPGHE